MKSIIPDNLILHIYDVSNKLTRSPLVRYTDLSAEPLQPQTGLLI
jgi:hypothetical protein